MFLTLNTGIEDASRSSWSVPLQNTAMARRFGDRSNRRVDVASRSVDCHLTGEAQKHVPDAQTVVARRTPAGTAESGLYCRTCILSDAGNTANTLSIIQCAPRSRTCSLLSSRIERTRSEIGSAISTVNIAGQYQQRSGRAANAEFVVFNILPVLFATFEPLILVNSTPVRCDTYQFAFSSSPNTRDHGRTLERQRACSQGLAAALSGLADGIVIR